MDLRMRRARRYAYKWRHYNKNSLPWNRLAIHREFMRRESFVRWPVHGNVLHALRRGMMVLGPNVHLEPNVWIEVMDGRLTIGEHTSINMGVFISVIESVEIGAHTGIGNGSFISDAEHLIDDPTVPFMWQGMVPKGKVTIGDHCWIGINSIITAGVTIGERCLVGANSVVTKDLPGYWLCGGIPAKPIRPIKYRYDVKIP